MESQIGYWKNEKSSHNADANYAWPGLSSTSFRSRIYTTAFQYLHCWSIKHNKSAYDINSISFYINLNIKPHFTFAKIIDLPI